MAAFKIVDQVLERNSRATKAGRSVHDVRVNHYYGLWHGATFLTPEEVTGAAP
jgi:hypothetical protein